MWECSRRVKREKDLVRMRHTALTRSTYEAVVLDGLRCDHLPDSLLASISGDWVLGAGRW